MKNVVVFQLARLGDILQSIPLLTNLKKRDFNITLLIDEKNFEICKDIRVIDEIIPFKINDYLKLIKENNYEKLFKRLKNFIDFLNYKKFDLLINLNHSEINFMLSTLLNIPEKKGFKVEKNYFIEFLYSIIASSRKLNPFNLVDVFNHFIDKPEIFKIKLSENYDDSVKLPDNFIVIHPGAGHYLRVLDLDSIIEFAKNFLKNYKEYFIILTGIKEELKYGKIIEEKLRNNRIINLIGKTNYYQLKYIIKNSECFISTDTGVMHIASALGTKILALFYASAFPFETGPYTENAIIITPDLNCYPCAEFRHCNKLECKKMINGEIIYECCEFLLEKKEKIHNTKDVIIYKPFFDNWGIYLKEIFTKNDKVYETRKKIREKRFFR